MQEILKEYLLPDRIVRRKETAVLILSDAVTAAIIHLLAADKTRNLDYDKIIDSVFKIKLDSGVESMPDFHEGDHTDEKNLQRGEAVL